METKYTKGPWVVEKSDHIGAVNVSFGFFNGYIEIWYHHGAKGTIDEAHANARLIAAAPELLEALVNARTSMLKSGINYDNAEIYNKINNAIKKATE